MCKSVGITKLGLGENFFHAFLDYYVNPVLWSNFAKNTKRFWQSIFFFASNTQKKKNLNIEVYGKNIYYYDTFKLT